MAVEEDETPKAEEEPEIQVEEEGGSGEATRPTGEEREQISVEEESDEPPEGQDEPKYESEVYEGPPEEEAAPGEAEADAGKQRPYRARAAEPDARKSPPVVMKKRKKVAAIKRPAAPRRRPPYGWISVLVVLMLVIAGYAGWSLLSPKTTVTARASFPATAESGALVSFDGGNSSSTGKGIVRYDWTFGDGASGIGRRTTHFYGVPAKYTVTLTVKDGDGTGSAPYRSLLTISALSVSVPPKKFNDRANYAVNGTVDVQNTDSYLYKVNVGGQQVTVSEVQLNLAGTLNQLVRDQHQEEDGFGASHSALWTTSNEVLSLYGRAFTSIYTVTVNGDLTYFEDSYADAATGGVFQVQSRARTSLRLSNVPAGQNSINSTDSLRAYPGVAGMAGQFLPENIYKGKTFSQTEGPGNGTHRSGDVNYTWTRMGIQNIGGLASLGLNITAERSYMDRNGFSEFHLNIWLNGSASMPTSVLVHVKGRSGDTTYTTDHLTTITEFKAGSGAIDPVAQNFDTDPLPPELFASPFVDVPTDGAGNSSLRFGPGQAWQEAAAKDSTFSQFLGDNPRAYAVAAKYFEGQLGPGSATWNLTFSWPGASTGYWVNVTRDILQQYNVRGDWLTSPPEVRTGEDLFGRMLTMSSAEGRLRGNDTETATTFFKGGSVNWAGGTSLELGSDPVYPGINLASMYASGERARYGVMLKKEGYTSAFAMDTGQMMYFYTHSSL